MRVIDLDASDWKVWLDVSNAILSALHAPDPYTRGSIDALLGLMVFGGVGAIAPP